MASANGGGSRSDNIGSWLSRNPDQKAATPAPQQAAAPAPTRAQDRVRSGTEAKTCDANGGGQAEPEKKPAPQKEAQEKPNTLPGSTPILSAGGFSSFR